MGWPEKPKIFNVGPFTEKACSPLEEKILGNEAWNSITFLARAWRPVSVGAGRQKGWGSGRSFGKIPVFLRVDPV